MIAAMNGHTNVVRELLAAGAAWDVESDDGKTALDYAEECYRDEIANAQMHADSAKESKLQDYRQAITSLQRAEGIYKDMADECSVRRSCVTRI